MMTLAQLRIDDANNRAEEANRAKSAFLAAVSHDLRQPLQTLMTINAIMQARLDDPELRRLLRDEQRSIESMSGLLNSLLTIGKLDSGAMLPNCGEVPLDSLFEELLRQIQSAADNKHVQLFFDAAHLTASSTDRALLFDLLQNLLGNAIRYTDHGGVTLRATQTAPNRILIEVIDTGIGIAAEALPKIWDDFYQVAPPRGAVHRGGHGLGLAIVKRIADVLNISLHVESTLARGTRFVFEVAGAHAKSQPLSETVAALPVAGNGGKVILVEDDVAVRQATEMYLNIDGYSVHAVGSLQEVDTLLDQLDAPPAIVISDFRLLRNELGSDAIDRIRDKYGETLPAIVLTGDTGGLPERMQRDAHIRLLNKPIDMARLTEAMHELVGDRIC